MIDSQEAPLKPERESLWQFAPPPDRERLRALFAIETELEASLRPGLEHSVAHARLGWWQEELQRVRDGLPRHPLTLTLLQHRSVGADTPLDLHAWTDCIGIDLACLAFETRADLDAYFQTWSACVFKTALDAPVTWDTSARELTDWGAALHELELLSDFLGHAWAGRIFWPLGQDPANADPWRKNPLAPAENDLLHQRMLTLAQAIRSHCHATLNSPQLGVARLWSAIALQQARRALLTLPSPYQPNRFAPLTHTLQTWWCAVQVQRGKLPAILRHANRDSKDHKPC